MARVATLLSFPVGAGEAGPWLRGLGGVVVRGGETGNEPQFECRDTAQALRNLASLHLRRGRAAPPPVPCPPQLLLGGKLLGTAYRASLVGLLLCKLSITYQYFVYIFVFYATDVLFMCDKIPSPSLSRPCAKRFKPHHSPSLIHPITHYKSGRDLPFSLPPSSFWALTLALDGTRPRPAPPHNYCISHCDCTSVAVRNRRSYGLSLGWCVAHEVTVVTLGQREQIARLEREQLGASAVEKHRVQ